MIDYEKLKPILEGYKEYFPTHFDGENNEKYKWEAVKHFQDHWNIDAEDFGEMFKQATDRTFNLLASGYAYPRGMITNFAKVDNEATRAMFRTLFDESVDLAARVDAFQVAAEDIRAKYDDGTWRNHYQNTNAISTYLWLRYPDKYYIYKYELYRAAATELAADYRPKRNGSVDSMIGGFQMYDEICEAIVADPDISNMVKNALTPTCYSDPGMKTTTIDLGFYLARFYIEERKAEQEEAEWFPKDYSPNISVDEWVDLLGDSSVFTQGSLQIMKRMKDYGGQATCTQLAVKYGGTKNFYNSGSSSLAKRVADKTSCPVMTRDTENSRWWPILYVGKEADKNEQGSYIWRLREELSEALDKVDLSDVELYETPEKTGAEHGYWWLTANPKIWSFADIKIGEEQNYTLYNENGNKRRVFQNFLDAKVGDTVIGYEANPVKKVVAIGRITQENDGESIYFEKVEGLTNPIEYQTLKDSPELAKMEFFVQPNGSLFKLTKGEFDFVTVWRCCTRVEHGPGECDAPTIQETDLQAAVMKAINKVVGQKSTVIANLETILEQTVICADEELAELDEKIKAVQLELVDRATSSEGYEDLARESDRLNEEKQKILVTLAEDKGRQEKKAELIDFLHEQTTEFEKFDDGLVRRLIEQITVHESGTFTVEFKSGTMVEV